MIKDTVTMPEDAILGPFTRSMGSLNSKEQLGGGFMCKAGTRTDHVDYDPSIYSLIYVFRGLGKYTDYHGVPFPLRPGMCFHRIPGYPHTTLIDPASDWHECFIDLGPVLAGALIDMRLIDPERPVIEVGLSQSLVNSFNTLHHRLKNAPARNLAKILSEMLLFQGQLLSMDIEKLMSREEAMVQTVCSALEANLNAPFDLKALCRQHGWGYETLRKAFRSLTGISPGQYRTRCRMDEAKRLLKGEPDLPIGTVATRLGYCSSYEFSARFKSHTNLSPRTYRNTT